MGTREAAKRRKANQETIAGLQIEEIGVLPQVVDQINDLADRPSTTAEEVARVILRDPTLTSKILRIVNSTFYGLRREIRSVPHAIAYLGIQQVRNLVVSSALIESFRFEHGVVEPAKVWEHSLGCAIGAKRLGDTLPGVSGDLGYLGGLLHDIGRIVLLSKFPDDYADVVGTCERGLCPLREAEESRFEISHEEAGFILGQAWGFSKSVLSMILHHHRPRKAGPATAQAALVGLANAVCLMEGLHFGFWVDVDFAPRERDRAIGILSETDPAIRDMNWDETLQSLVESIQHTKTLVADLFR